MNSTKSSFERPRRVAVKVGSNVLTEAQGLNLKATRSLARQINWDNLAPTG